MKKQKNKLIDRFEKENDYFKEKHKTAFKEIKANRRAVAGYLEEGNKERVRANLILSTLQALLPHLFAKSPEVSINPAEKVNPVDGDAGGELYQQANAFSETGRIVLKRVMMRAKLKKKARKAVRAAATAKLGIIKVSYRKDYESDDLVKSEIQTQQMQIAKIQAMISNIEEGTPEFEKLQQTIVTGQYQPEKGCEQEDEIQRISSTIQSLQAQVRKVVGQGIHLTCIPLDQMRWDVSVPAEDMHDGKFISHFIYDTIENAKARFNINEPEDVDKEESRVKSWKTFPSVEVNQDDEEQNLNQDKKSQKKYVRIWERWDAETSSVYTWIEGDREFARPEKQPQMFEDMWYPFFALGLNDIDGSDLPVSTVETLIPLQKQYEELMDLKDENIKASIPYTIYDKAQLNAKEFMPEVKSVGSRDFVGVNGNGVPINQLFTAGPSVPLNERLYDTQPILFEMQNVSGVGDAERGGIARAKTLGEAEIVQRGLATRTEDARDAVESWLADMFKYAFGLCLKNMTSDEVSRIAGPHAYWPNMSDTADEFYQLVDVDIEAGSSGRPDKVSDQQVWFENLELINGSIEAIMGMRQQGIPDDQNPMYRMLEESMRRLDERIDIATILPETEVIEPAIQLIQSIQQQLQQISNTPEGAQLAQMGAQLLGQNPVVQQLQGQAA